MAIAKVVYKENASATGEVWMDTTKKTVTSGAMLSGTTALKNDGTDITGNIASKSSSDLTVSGATVTAPAGFYASSASKSVGTVTHPNPTASINSSTGVVTATHVQPTGYVTGGTTTGTLSLTTQAAKTVTPSETSQVAVAKNVYTTGAVNVGAISSTYIGSAIPQREYSEATVMDNDVVVPYGYYSATNTYTVPAVSLASPTVSLNSTTGVVTATQTQASGYVSGATKTGTLSLTTLGTTTYNPSLSAQTIASGQYLTGEQTIAPVSLQSKTVTPTESAQTVTADSDSISATPTSVTGLSSSPMVATIGLDSIEYGKTYQVTGFISYSEDYSDGGNSILEFNTSWLASEDGEVSFSKRSGYGVTPSKVTLSKTQIKLYFPSGTTILRGSIGNGAAAYNKLTFTDAYIGLSSVTVNGISSTYIGSGVPTLGASTYTPTESVQTIASARYLTGAQTINAISSTYVGTGVARKASATYTPTETTQVITNDQYLTGAQTIAAISSTYVGTGVTKKAAATIYPSTVAQTIASGQYLSGEQTFASVRVLSLEASYIKSGVTIMIGDSYDADRIAKVAGTMQGAESFAAIYKSLAYGNTIRSEASLVSEWANSLTTISFWQFAGFPFAGSFTFANVTSVGQGAFGVLWNGTGYSLRVPSVWLNFPNLSFSAITTETFYCNGMLHEVVAPHVSFIATRAFYSCANLSNVDFPACSFMSDSAFAKCTKLTVASFPMCTSIGSSAFQSCSALTMLSFPSCKSIGPAAFVRCTQLKSIDFPACTLIEANAFSGCTNLSVVSFPVCETMSGYAFDGCPALNVASFPNCESIGAYAFRSCSSLSIASFPHCTTISSGVFVGCTALTQVYFPSCLTIGSYAFSDCSALSTAEFPACETINYGVFSGCHGLTTISFPNCTSIGAYAFAYCWQLSEAFFPNCLTISSNAFLSCSSIATVSIPVCEYIGGSAFQYCANLVSLYLGSSIPGLTANGFHSTPISNYSTVAGRYGSIYVPSSMLATYKTATGWAAYSARMVGY